MKKINWLFLSLIIFFNNLVYAESSNSLSGLENHKMILSSYVNSSVYFLVLICLLLAVMRFYDIKKYLVENRFKNKQLRNLAIIGKSLSIMIFTVLIALFLYLPTLISNIN